MQNTENDTAKIDEDQHTRQSCQLINRDMRMGG